MSHYITYVVHWTKEIESVFLTPAADTCITDSHSYFSLHDDSLSKIRMCLDQCLIGNRHPTIVWIERKRCTIITPDLCYPFVFVIQSLTDQVDFVFSFFCLYIILAAL